LPEDNTPENADGDAHEDGRRSEEREMPLQAARFVGRPALDGCDEVVPLPRMVSAEGLVQTAQRAFEFFIHDPSPNLPPSPA